MTILEFESTQKQISSMNNFTIPHVDLSIGHYGFEVTNPNKSSITGESYPSYRLHYIINGSVTLTINSKKYKLRKNTEKKLEVKIPAGVDNGSKMRLSQEGDAGKNGGIAGDLYIVIHVKPSSYYERDGVNVFTKLELNPAQAVLGDTVTIKTLDGEKDVTIPAGIQNGEFVKIRNAGIPNISKPSVRGDHIIVVDIKTPTHITSEERVLYQKLYNISANREGKPSMKEKLKGVFK